MYCLTMDGASGWLITQGPLGVGLVLALVGLGRLWLRYEAVQEARITEAKEAGERMERLAKSSTNAVRKLYRALGEKDDPAPEE